MESTSTTVAGVRIIGDDEVQRANELDAKAKDIGNTFATALAPVQRDISNATLDTYQAFLDIEQVIARVVTSAVNLYTQISGVVGQVRELVGSVPYIGKLITAGNPITFLNEYLKTGKSLLQGAGVLSPDAPAAEGKPKSRVRVTLTGDQDKSNKLPSLGARKGRDGSESLDAVETYINQLEKARDVARAELENVGKTNVERTKSVDLAKAEAAAREANQRSQRSSPTLTDAERTKVLSLAEDTAKAEDSQKNLEQQLRQNAEAARLFSDSLSNGLADAIVNGKSFGSVLGDIVKQLERSAITGLLTGQGRIGGVFGFKGKAKETADVGDQRAAVPGRSSGVDGRGALPRRWDADGDGPKGRGTAASECGDRGPGAQPVPAAHRLAVRSGLRHVRRASCRYAASGPIRVRAA